MVISIWWLRAIVSHGHVGVDRGGRHVSPILAALIVTVVSGFRRFPETDPLPPFQRARLCR
jgi:hypothetical protein